MLSFHYFTAVFLLIVTSAFNASANDYLKLDENEGLLPGHPILVNEPELDKPLESASQSFPVFSKTDMKADSVEWTILFYDDAEFAGYDPLSDFANECRGTDNISVIALQDDTDNPAFLWQILPDGSLVLLEELGEVNMGSGITLQNFLEYGKSNFPAERYFLAMYDHGGGWRGACLDETSGNDQIEMNEMNRAIDNAGGIDILAFTAPCLMGALESAYELRNSVDVYIGSQEISGYILWRGMMDDLAALLDSSATVSNQEIGAAIVDLFQSNFPPQYSDWATMSAVDQVELQAMVTQFDQLCVYLEANISDVAPHISLARDSVTEMGMGGTYHLSEIDFGDFLQVYLEIETDPYIISQLETIQLLFQQAVINNCYGPLYTRVHGLSLYFPAVEEGSQIQTYLGADLDIVDQSNWDEFLFAYYNWQLQGIEETNGNGETFTIQPMINPASGSVEFICNGSSEGNYLFTVSDIAGRTVYSTSHTVKTTGSSIIAWNGYSNPGEAVPSGIYLARITDSSGNSATTTLIMR